MCEGMSGLRKGLSVHGKALNSERPVAEFIVSAAFHRRGETRIS